MAHLWFNEMWWAILLNKTNSRQKLHFTLTSGETLKFIFSFRLSSSSLLHWCLSFLATSSSQIMHTWAISICWFISCSHGNLNEQCGHSHACLVSLWQVNFSNSSKDSSQCWQVYCCVSTRCSLIQVNLFACSLLSTCLAGFTAISVQLIWNTQWRFSTSCLLMFCITVFLESPLVLQSKTVLQLLHFTFLVFWLLQDRTLQWKFHSHFVLKSWKHWSHWSTWVPRAEAIFSISTEEMGFRPI